MPNVGMMPMLCRQARKRQRANPEGEGRGVQAARHDQRAEQSSAREREKRGRGRAPTDPRAAHRLADPPLTLALQARLAPALDLAHGRDKLAQDERVGRRVAQRVEPVPHKGVVRLGERRRGPERVREGKVGARLVGDEEVSRGEVLRGDDLVARQVAQDRRLACLLR